MRFEFRGARNHTVRSHQIDEQCTSVAVADDPDEPPEPPEEPDDIPPEWYAAGGLVILLLLAAAYMGTR